MPRNKNQIYRNRRIAVVVAGLGAIATAAFGAKELAGAVDHASNVNQEVTFFSQPNLADRYSAEDPKVRLTPTDVTFAHVEAGEATPMDVARRMGAVDVYTAGQEIAAQVGGEHSMQAGDYVVLPNDQLKGSE